MPVSSHPLPTIRNPVFCPVSAENGRKASLTRKFPYLSKKQPEVNVGSLPTLRIKEQRPDWARWWSLQREAGVAPRASGDPASHLDSGLK